ncbi:hypothetical protein C1645_804206 [Glomus cerebriforme]|uniref:Uncharacterized protein n=1 Tax=Glomus cerebriforme TaxID=658196 RepID=A0A397T4J3_9GLOM|nr:hypothetical protein C1645_804206 [Glomus cerebriforme]
METPSFNEKENVQNTQSRYFIFLGIFLTEIIFCIMGIVLLQISKENLIIFFSVLFMSGIYVVSILNSYSDIVNDYFPGKLELYISAMFDSNDYGVKMFIEKFKYPPFDYDMFEKEFKKIFIFPYIIAGDLIIFFDILFIILLIMWMWREKCWNTKIPEGLEKMKSDSKLDEAYEYYEYKNVEEKEEENDTKDKKKLEHFLTNLTNSAGFLKSLFHFYG